MEIEKKYLVKQLPEGVEKAEKWEIEQCYLCQTPTLRIRKRNDEYILTYKNRQKPSATEKLCVSNEIEAPLTKESYEHLKQKTDGICIKKTRYRIPYGKYIIELDIFHGEYEGKMLAEVEFATEEEVTEFVVPEWFGEDVSGDYHYTNSFLANPLTTLS